MHLAVFIGKAAIKATQRHAVDGTKALAVEIRFAIVAADTHEIFRELTGFDGGFTSKACRAVIIVAQTLHASPLIWTV